MSPNSHNTLCKSADTVVVGGGVVGTAIAYFLARDGIDVCLLERKDIGSGTTSSAAVAALLQTKTSPEKLALADKSLTLLDELFDALDGSFEYEHSGSLLVASNEAEMQVVQQMNDTLTRLGLDVKLVDRDEAREIMPILGKEILGGTFSPRDALINPLSLVTAYARAAQQAGAKICTFTSVTGIKKSGNRIVAIQTDRGEIQTETVINAAGVWAPQLGRMAGVELPIEPLKGELLITEATKQQLRGTLISAKYLLSKSKLERSAETDAPKRSVGITLAQVARGNFVIGSTREQAGFNRESTYEGIYEQCRQLLELTPSLSHLHLIRAYGGLRPITPDGLPIISRMTQVPQMIVASGFGGDGLALSAVAADIILSLLKGTPDPALTDLLSIDRFSSGEVYS